jgi:farnesyl-diphosphate farnesyltransferase
VNLESSRTIGASRNDFDYQAKILPGVSRTFALTIPVLPERLALVVTNAYLLCRLADTIEDDVALDNEQKSTFHERFVAIVEGREAAEPFAVELAPLLSSRALPAERELVEQAAAVVRVTHSFSPEERAALTRCVRVMCEGMPEFQRNKSLRGLDDLEEMTAYCYYVAGVVGEMLTDLFCLHCPELKQHRERLMGLAVSFGQGLQMTNILKDIWDDRHADTCWLPRSVFGSGTFSLERLEDSHMSSSFRDGLNQLLGVVELPLVISDHADWPELVATIAETGAEEIWVTHGREEALVHQIGRMGRRGRALALVGREDEGREDETE